MNNQIIVFINPEKFTSLLPIRSKKIGIKEHNKDIDEYPVYLHGNDYLVYIDQIGRTEIKEYNENAISEASIVLIPDDKIIGYIPNPMVNHKILYHSITEQRFPFQYNRLKCTSNCIGCFKDNEGPGTVYHKIANFINTDGSITFQNIWDLIPEINYVLEAKLELLHNCLHHESVPSLLDTLLSDYDTVFEIFKRKIQGKTLFDIDYINALTELRIALLGS